MELFVGQSVAVPQVCEDKWRAADDYTRQLLAPTAAHAAWILSRCAVSTSPPLPSPSPSEQYCNGQPTPISYQSGVPQLSVPRAPSHKQRFALDSTP